MRGGMTVPRLWFEHVQNLREAVRSKYVGTDVTSTQNPKQLAKGMRLIPMKLVRLWSNEF